MHTIKNDDQKFKTLSRINDFETRISEIRKSEGPKSARIYQQAFASHIKDLARQVREYERLKQGQLPAGRFSDAINLGQYLIKARIVSGLTQAELAQKLAVSQPMVYKYELSKYTTCGFDVLAKAAAAMGISLSVKVKLRSVRLKARTAGRRA